MKPITAELCREHHACVDDARLAELFPRPMTPMEVLTRRDGAYADVLDAHRVWAVLLPGVLSYRVRGVFACNCAERALSRVTNPDPRSVEAVRVRRLYIDGKATAEKMRRAKEEAYAAYVIHASAVSFARVSAAYSATRVSAAAAAAATGYAVAAACACAADDTKAERAAQVADLIRLIKEHA